VQSSLHNLFLVPEFAATQVYELYTDYVLKNPFYEVEQPIRCEKFDLHLNELMRQRNAIEKK